jgi:4-oxalocrotonate tautomerase
MPLVQVTVRQGRPPEAIRKMISAVTEAVVQSLNAPLENVRVIVHEVPGTHWANGNVTLQEKSSQLKSVDDQAAGSDMVD